MDFTSEFAMVKLCWVPIFMKFGEPLFFIFWPPKMPFDPHFDSLGIKILKNGLHHQVRHGQIVSGTKFYEIWKTFNFSIPDIFRRVMVKFAPFGGQT